MTRTYTNTIESVSAWKQKTLSTLSDLSKDVHGTRWLPADITAPDATMEAILDFYTYCLRLLIEQREQDVAYADAIQDDVAYADAIQDMDDQPF